MKKRVLLILFSFFTVGMVTPTLAQRFLSPIFPTVSITPNVVYGNNKSVLTGTPTSTDLKMDIYQPAGAIDPMPKRPLVIYIHTGSFLPIIYNGQPTGWKTDSAAVEICSQLAKRGYVAASIDYRLGWNPAALGSAGQDIRTGTLLQAVYRSIQDAKAAVRYFKENYAIGGNTYAVDTNKIILYGQGSGGYVALAYATLDQPSEIALPKFLANTTDATYGFVAGQPYVNQLAMGDFEGHGGLPAYNDTTANHMGYSSRISMVVNAGGAMGDISWMSPGDVPMICFHIPSDPFAPYGDGPVIVPTTGDFVVDVSGSATIIDSADSYGNNNSFLNAGFTDAYTTQAMFNQSIDNYPSGNREGLFPLITPTPQAGPWEWYDSTMTTLIAIGVGKTAADGTNAYVSALLTNPDMSKAKALAYIDTIMNYMNPRILYALNLSAGIPQNAVSAANVLIQPNPATDQAFITLSNINDPIRSVRIYNQVGQEVLRDDELNDTRLTINRNNLPSGMYLVKISFANGEVTKKVIFE